MDADTTLRLSVSAGPAANTELRRWTGDFDALADLMSNPKTGVKDGSYLVRGPHNGTATRADEHIVKAYVVILDGDKRIDPETGELFEGAPSAEIVHEALTDAGVSHLIFSSHSHADPERGGPGFHRWRCVVPVELANAEELRAVVDHLIDLLHRRNVALAPVKENYSWSQAWFLPRLRAPDAPFLFLRYDDGDPLDVPAIVAAYRAQQPAAVAVEPSKSTSRTDSAIGRFLAEHGSPAKIIERLESRGYGLRGTTTVNGEAAYRLIRPGSTSGMPGVTVFRAKTGKWLTSSHHGAEDPLAQLGANGRALAHDAFDVFRILEHGGDEKAALRAIRPPRTEIAEFDEPPMVDEFGNEIPVRDQDEPQKPARKSDDTVIIDGHGAISMSEDAIALAFAASFSGKLLYNHTAKRWHHWDGAIWKREETRLAYEWARRLTRELNAEGKARWARSAVFSSVETIASADRAFAKTVHDFDRDPWLLGTPQGTVDLRPGSISPPDPASLITRSTGFAPAGPGVEPARWLAFLDEATRGDADLTRFLQKVCGYSLTGRTTEHLLVFIFGPGGNGKGVFLSVLTAVFGDYAQAASMETFTASKYDRHPTEIAALAGSRLVTAQETESGRSWAESRIKALTGGDRIRARFMRCDEFEFDPEFQLILVGNHKPRIQSLDDAMRRRLALIEFMHKPKAVNPRLADELLTEGPAILRWMIDGCLAWQHEGLSRPQSVIAATNEYFADEDRIGAWLDLECDIGARFWEPAGLLYGNWTLHCKANGEDSGTAAWFGEELNRRGFYVDRSKYKKPRCGLRLKPRECADDEPWGYR